MSAALPTVRLRLSVMMFLQYAIWGAWLPLLFPFLLSHRGFDLDQISTIFMGGAAGAIVGPFIAGQIADRYFSTERFLAFSHLIGAVIVWRLASTTEFSAFLALSVVYGLVYAPTLALTNSLSFHHLPNRDRDFGPVRLWGTIGWIAVGILVGQWLLHQHTPASDDANVIAAAQNAGRADAFKLSAILGVIHGLYCFTLPHTPPARDVGRKNAVGEALAYVKLQPLLMLFLLAVPVSCIHQFYFMHTSPFLSTFQTDADDAINKLFGVGGGGLMTIGQMSEIFVLALIPKLAQSASRKTLLAIGLAAYALRMALFAYTDSLETVLLGVMLHGLCFGCFIFVAFMVVDEETPADVRASAQNLFNLVIVGIGTILGSWLASSVVAGYAQGEAAKLDYADRAQTTVLFSIPMWASLACLAVLLAFYPSKRRAPAPAV
jgi:nucleoside transporter